MSTKTFTTVNMSDRIFNRLGQFIHAEYGIKMPLAKKTMLQGRLQKRLRSLGMNSFEEYCDYALKRQNFNETIQMIDLVSTNKTDFFREPNHFDYLVQVVLPELTGKQEMRVGKKFIIWSAGCSTGEEPYTLAMVLNEFAEKNPGFRFAILATDISTQVLDKAKLAIYKNDKVKPIPMALKKKYLLKSKDSLKDVIRIVPKLRSRIRFHRLNFMDDDFGIREPVDIIFCRNVIIYFDIATQKKILSKFHRQLVPGGYIFMGHSETLSGLDLPFVSTATTVYRKVG